MIKSDFDNSTFVVTPRKTWRESGREWGGWGGFDMDSITSSLPVTPPSVASKARVSVSCVNGREVSTGYGNVNVQEISSRIGGSATETRAWLESQGLRKYLPEDVSLTSHERSTPDYLHDGKLRGLEQDEGYQSFRETFKNFLRRSMRESVTGNPASTAGDCKNVDEHSGSMHKSWACSGFTSAAEGQSATMRLISREMLHKTVVDFEKTVSLELSDYGKNKDRSGTKT